MILEFILFRLRKQLQSFFSSSLQQLNKGKKKKKPMVKKKNLKEFYCNSADGSVYFF
jgi:hypothetical protein